MSNPKPRAVLLANAVSPPLRAQLAPGALRGKLDSRQLYQWRGPFELWARSWVRRHYWRVRNVLPSEEDALQECAVVFVRCVNKYADTVDEPRWMMALFKTSVANAWNRLSCRDSEERAALEQYGGTAATSEYAEGPLAAKLAWMPHEAMKVLCVMAQAPQEMLDLLLEEPSREVQNGILRRWCRLPKGTDVLGLLQSSLA